MVSEYLGKIRYIHYIPRLQLTLNELLFQLFYNLTLEAPRKKCIWKCRLLIQKSSAAKKLPSITDELSIEANSVDPEQTAPIGVV